MAKNNNSSSYAYHEHDEEEFFPSDYVDSQSSLLSNENGNIERYNNVLLCDHKKIFGCISVTPTICGIIRILCDVIGLIVFTISVGHRKPEYLGFILQYIFWSYLICPLWQNYKIINKATKEEISDANGGCILGFILMTVFGLFADHLDIQPREAKDARYIPLSIYNDLYLILHPGYELNPNLPKDMKYFGVARIFLLIYSASSKASYNLIVFYNAIHVYTNDHDYITTTIAFVALIIALTDLRIYVLTSIFGALFNPYMLLLTLSLFFPMCPFLLNPSQGNPIYFILEFYWRLIVQCS